MKSLIFLIASLASFYCSAFEIKPQGSNSSDWINDINSINYLKERPCPQCEESLYKVFSSKPVHESITSNAVILLCKNVNMDIENILYDKCANYIENRNNVFHDYSANDALITGSQYNDDPTELLMLHQPLLNLIPYFSDKLKADKFTKISLTPDTLTYRSHYGDHQFLHAMKSCENEPKEETIRKSVEYIKSNFNMAKRINQWVNNKEWEAFKIFLSDYIQPGDYYYQFLGLEDQCDYDKYASTGSENSLPDKTRRQFKFLFSQCGDFSEYGELSKCEYELLETDDKKRVAISKAISLLALGSALHVIQDSYSSSHVDRNSKWKIKGFYKYPNHVSGEFALHCEHDQASKNNEAQINQAKFMSYEFLKLFVVSGCNPSDNSSENTCNVEVENWLLKNVFQTI